MQAIRAVHYLNQFFGGIGGEDKADAPVRAQPGAVGPGIALESFWSGRAKIALTIIGGDNYVNENLERAIDDVVAAARQVKPQVFIAGPAFNAGRYGFACGALGRAIVERLGIPAVVAMSPDNPAVEAYRKVRGLWIIPSGPLAADMPKVLPKLAEFVVKVGSGAPIGPARAEGFIPSGRRELVWAELPGAERALAMLLAKLAGRPFQTEIPVEHFEQVLPAAPVKELKKARLAVITTSGLVPKGNPDGFRMFNATQWRRYPLPDAPRLEAGDWELIHGGFNTAYAQANPNLVLPLDALRELAGERYAELYGYFYSITGVGTSLTVARRAGQEIAASLRAARIDAAILVAT